jgi:hypothetical protein
MLNKFFGLFEGKKTIWLLMFVLLCNIMQAQRTFDLGGGINQGGATQVEAIDEDPSTGNGTDKANINYQAKSVTTSDYRTVSGFEQMGVIVNEELKSYNIRLRSDDVYEVTIQKLNPTGAAGEVVKTKFEGNKMYLYDASGQLVFEDDFSSEVSGSAGVNMEILQLSQTAVSSYIQSVAPASSFGAAPSGGGSMSGLVNIDASPDRQLAFDAGSGLLVAESTYANGQVVSDVFYKSSRNGGQFVLEGIDQILYSGANQPKTHITTQVIGYQAQFNQTAINNLSRN